MECPHLLLRKSARVSISQAVHHLASAFTSCSGSGCPGLSMSTHRLACCDGISWRGSLSWTFYLALQRLEPRPLSLLGKCPTTELSPQSPLSCFWLTYLCLSASDSNCHKLFSTNVPQIKKTQMKTVPRAPTPNQVKERQPVSRRSKGTAEEAKGRGGQGPGNQSQAAPLPSPLAAWWLVITGLFRLLIFKATVVWRVRMGEEPVKAPEAPRGKESGHTDSLQGRSQPHSEFHQKMEIIDIQRPMDRQKQCCVSIQSNSIKP